MGRSLTIVKDNCLIDNFVFNATELELQVLNYAVAITNPYWDNRDLVYKISIPELVQHYGTKTNKRAWERYRKALLRLQIRTFTFYEGHKKNIIPLIKMVTEDVRDNSYLEFRFSEYLQNRIQNLKGLFTQYDIKNICMFKSRYAFMLYEFFKMKLLQNRDGYNKKMAVNDFRKNLDLLDRYRIFRDLKDNVIEKAKTQINKHSDIRMHYSVIKTGRTPTHLQFSAKFKKGRSPAEILEKLKTDSLDSENGDLENLKTAMSVSENENSESSILKNAKTQSANSKTQKQKKTNWENAKSILRKRNVVI